MSNEEFVQVEYVGLKDEETDHLYGTGLVWKGQGDVKRVPRAAWERMKAHPDVWQLADGEPKGKAPQKPATDAAAVEAQRVENERVAADLAEQKRELDKQAAALLAHAEEVAKRESAVAERETALTNAGGDAPDGLAGGAGAGAITPPDYEAMDRNALAKLCTERKLEVDGRSAKAALIEALKAADAAKA